MQELKSKVAELYGQRIRVRVCGMLLSEGRLLLARHHGLGPEGVLWVPPGGGLQLGETLEQALQREFREETGLEVAVREFLFLHEYIALPLHAIELFYRVEQTGGRLVTGTDPEMQGQEQIIKQVTFVTEAGLAQIPEGQRHDCLQGLARFTDLLQAGGAACIR